VNHDARIGQCEALAAWCRRWQAPPKPSHPAS
jgi:hypothetical protein